MVGRESEMSALRRLWTEAEAGRGQFAIVSGEAGIGKSRLTQSVKDHIGQLTGRTHRPMLIVPPARGVSPLDRSR